jgi:hypothetical protein
VPSRWRISLTSRENVALPSRNNLRV